MKLPAHPLRVINYTELVFAFVAHVITIPILGVLTGLMCGCAVLYTIRIQADGSKPRTKKVAFLGTLGFKLAQLWIHQTSFLFIFTWSGKTLPFGWPLEMWAWIITLLLFALDIWALWTTAQEAAEQVMSAELHERKAEQAEREARAERERQAQRERDAAERIQLAQIRAAAKTQAKLAAEETRRKEAEEQRKTEEAKWKAEEEARKLEEQRWKAEEERRNREELERKEAERLRKAEEAERKQKEAAEKEAQREKWRLQKKKQKINGEVVHTEA